MIAPDTPWMNDELRSYEESVVRFFVAELVPNVPRWMAQGQVDRSFWEQAGDLGILGASIPEAYGGVGGNFAHDAVVYLSQGSTEDFGFAFAVHNIAAHYILAFGTEAQKQRWLPRLSSGELIGAIAMTEPDAGSDLQGVKTRAEAKGNEYRMSGSKVFISNGQIANLFLVVSKTEPFEGSEGISLFGMETDGLEGFTRGRNLEKLGLKSQDTSELATKLEVTRAFVDKCMLQQLDGKLDASSASMAKWWSTQVQCDIVDECLQLHGGYGYMMESPIAKLYADSRVQKIYGGTNEIMKELIARSLDAA